MRVVLHHDPIARIERDIARFQERATELLRRERAAESRLASLEAQPAEHRRLRRRWAGRRLAAARAEVEQRRDQRSTYVEQNLRAILLTLEEQSRRTREHLDRELERLIPVQDEWERLRGAFELVEAAVTTPAVEEQGGRWRGNLGIPEFPVREHEGYLKPFPENALLF